MTRIISEKEESREVREQKIKKLLQIGEIKGQKTSTIMKASTASNNWSKTIQKVAILALKGSLFNFFICPVFGTPAPMYEEQSVWVKSDKIVPYRGFDYRILFNPGSYGFNHRNYLDIPPTYPAFVYIDKKTRKQKPIAAIDNRIDTRHQIFFNIDGSRGNEVHFTK
ncbi:MAG TPA: hypothetical protein ENI23_10845 [bacterium]|nr:hypothetical protein [bacterium]